MVALKKGNLNNPYNKEITQKRFDVIMGKISIAFNKARIKRKIKEKKQ